ncbi:Hypothetical protein PHPALM_7402 [Phytophthora palmivora]|uniref:Uncharacterized protein n=1 Tax=Phytophthora palmivora TaxID=4796 RepID=A0A2P4YCF7_9STRA|nr:Hypothetical protein PHPALM_7402 [Phytophthora palmivora]
MRKGEGLELQNQSGGRANFLNDIWQNSAKLHLLGAQLALFGFIVTLGLFPTGSCYGGFELANAVVRDGFLS